MYHRGTVASEARRGAESSGAGVIGGCEQPNVVAEKKCLLLRRSVLAFRHRVICLARSPLTLLTCHLS